MTSVVTLDLSAAYHLLGQHEKARTLLIETLGFAATEASLPRQIWIYIAVARQFVRMMEYREGECWAWRALQLASEAPFPVLFARAAEVVAEFCEYRHRFVDAEVWLNTARRNWRTIGRYDQVSRVLVRLGLLYARIGRRDRALSSFSAALTIARRTPAKTGEFSALVELYHLQSSLGQITKSSFTEYLAAALERSYGVGHLLPEEIFTIGRRRMFLGEWKAALQRFEELEEDCRRTRSLYLLPNTALGRASCLLAMGDYKKALDAYWLALDRIRPNYEYRLSTLIESLDGLAAGYAALGSARQSSEFHQLSSTFLHIVRPTSAFAPDVDTHIRLFLIPFESTLSRLRTDVSDFINIRGVLINFAKRRATRRDKRVVTLSSIQSTIIRFLIAREGQPATNDDIVHCYSPHLPPGRAPRRAHYFADAINKKLGTRLIETLPGVGYFISLS
jgi:tetratricopeptide (TPR) repeat protein